MYSSSKTLQSMQPIHQSRLMDEILWDGKSLLSKTDAENGSTSSFTSTRDWTYKDYLENPVLWHDLVKLKL